MKKPKSLTEKFKPLRVKPLYPIHKPKNKKNLRYFETDLKPLGDVDNDNKLNVIDCFPYDPSRQGLTDIKRSAQEKLGKAEQTIAKGVSTVKEKAKGKYEELTEKSSDIKQIIILKDGIWRYAGPMTADYISQAIEEYKDIPSITSASAMSGSKADALKEITKRNARVAGETAVEGARKTGEMAKKEHELYKKATPKRGIKTARKNIKAGMQINEEGLEDIQQSFSGGTASQPKMSKGWWGSWSSKKSGTTPIRERSPKPSFSPQPKPEPQEYQQQRKIPPGAVRYKPVSLKDTFVSYRPVKVNLSRERLKEYR